MQIRFRYVHQSMTGNDPTDYADLIANDPRRSVSVSGRRVVSSGDRPVEPVVSRFGSDGFSPQRSVGEASEKRSGALQISRVGFVLLRLPAEMLRYLFPLLDSSYVETLVVGSRQTRGGGLEPFPSDARSVRSSVLDRGKASPEKRPSHRPAVFAFRA
jgi:hypothetical protein